MPLDGAMLSQVKQEIEAFAVGSRVDKIYQPSREEVILSLRGRQGSAKLLISVGASSPRIHFTQVAVENPKSPPMFCMLMRKLFGASLLTGVEQAGLDRILHLRFETIDEFGDKVPLLLSVEIMGRHSNLIIHREDGRIVDAIKRIDATMSTVRPVLPGMQYVLPPSKGEKCDLMTAPFEQIADQLRLQGGTELSKGLMAALQGVSPLFCREVAFFTLRGAEKTVSELREEEWERLRFYLETLAENLRRHDCHPVMLVEQGKPRDFTFLDVQQYGDSMERRPFETYSQLLDSFYGERDTIDRMRQRSNDLLRLVGNTTERIARRLETQRQELEASRNREQYKVFGDLISTNMYALQKGDRVARVQNYYEADLPMVEIPLDVRLTPNQNAQKYYNEYRKLDTAEKKLREQIAQGEMELRYIESVYDMLTRARSESELTAIRQELSQEGYLKHTYLKGKKEEKLPPLKFRSSDGFTILVGRNNVQNDRLTLKESRGGDIWFHTQKIPGSHTIVVTDGREVPNRTLEEACILAAYHSKARDSSKVAVDYTPVKYVKKPNGSKPGMVIYEVYQTAIVDPDKDLVERLAEK